MIKTGLVSITFRELSPKKIVKMVKKAGLAGIEWGGDIHVPHGNLKKAGEVKDLTKNAGLEVAAYGSYYRVGADNSEIGSFQEILDTASELGAPLIRVWAGDKGSDEADKSWWKKVITESREIAELASEKNIKVAYEYHGGTLTDTIASAQKLLKKVNHDNVYTYWQPPHHMQVESRLESLESIIHKLTNLHVFYWEDHERYPLQKARRDWIKYLKRVKEQEGTHYAMLEFVKDDDPEQFFEDAAVLKEIIHKI